MDAAIVASMFLYLFLKSASDFTLHVKDATHHMVSHTYSTQYSTSLLTSLLHFTVLQDFHFTFYTILKVAQSVYMQVFLSMPQIILVQHSRCSLYYI